MECGVSGLHVDLLEFSVKIFFFWNQSILVSSL
jgi:hypothetical protein